MGAMTSPNGMAVSPGLIARLTKLHSKGKRKQTSIRIYLLSICNDVSVILENRFDTHFQLSGETETTLDLSSDIPLVGCSKAVW